MKDLFEYIKARLNARVPTIKTVRMFNDQFVQANQKRMEKAFKYPACFVEFIVIEVYNRCLGIKDYILTVRFRFGRESYKWERLETFDFCDSFTEAIQLMAPTTASQLTFTTFQEIQTEFDENFTNVEIPYTDYRTMYRSTAGYQRKTDLYIGPITPLSTGVIIPIDDLHHG